MLEGRSGLRHMPRFRWLSRLGFMAYVSRVPTLAALGTLFIGWRVDQIHEILRVLVLDVDEGAADSTSSTTLAAIYLSLFMLSWTLLFWTEYALAKRFPRPLANNLFLKAAFAGMPALLAYLPWVGGALALGNADEGLPPSAHTLALVLKWTVVGVGLVCIATYFSTQARSAFQRKAGTAPRDAGSAFGQFEWLLASLFLGLGLFSLAATNPWKMGAWFGTIGTMVAACVALVPFLTWLTTSDRFPRWHWLTILLGVAVLWSYYDLNDNHELRELSDRKSFVTAPAFDNAFQLWLLARSPLPSDEPFPVVFVAAEGGGIRAAYFTAQVLAAFQDRCPEFARHLFAVSGVSGGSVGAAVFTGMLANLKASPAQERLACSVEPDKTTGFADGVESVLKTDYLAPLVATLLFPDALQRFLPFKVPAWDRTRTLERSIESSFRSTVGTDFLEKSLYSYWSPTKNLPVLLLNSTHVASGARVIASPVALLNERFHRLLTFFDFVPSADFRISTVAVNSARFPLVTPAGVILNGDEKHRFVDGGYFENSGAVTLAEAVNVAMEAARQMKRTIRPVVVRIGNSPSTLAGTAHHPPKAESGDHAPMGLGELLSPLRAMFNTRTARGALAADMLETAVTTLQDGGVLADFVQFQIGVSDVQIPLGWQLSTGARRALRAQLSQPTDCGSRNGIVNGCGVVDVVQVLRDWSGR